MAKVAANVNKIVKWFQNHSYALGLLRQCQQEYGKTLALILTVITRWTAHYCAAACLLEIAQALWVCVVWHEAGMLKSAGPASSEGQKTGQYVFNIIKDHSFWGHLLM
ncbi:hypothetical protein FS749_004761 [Ceratobasidium sp. UAMH 11750]|nr:hypothetical protein FS749_004761 [Ceratobasidium sp. UAMH 11750]